MKTFPFVLLVALDAFFLDMGSTVFGQSQAGLQILERLAEQPDKPTPAAIDLRIRMANESLGRPQSDLAEQAIGSVLSKQLQLQELSEELQQATPNPDTLRKIEGSLRRILPGHTQKAVDDLRSHIHLLARQISCSAEEQTDLKKAMDALKLYLRDGQSAAARKDETIIRNAFRTIEGKHVDIDQVALLRNHLSLPNYLSRVRSDFLIRESNRSITIPIEFQKCTDNTSIAGAGKFQVNLSLEIPTSNSESFLRICADGKGMIDVTAQRSKAQVCARIEPKICGVQGVHLRVKDISADQPYVKASLKTDLSGINIDSILGRSRLIQNVAKRVIQKS